MEKHVKTIHENIKAYKCESCEKSFSQKGNLERHVKTVHENLKNHKCEACGKSFSQKGNLIRHLKYVHENIKDFSCDVCDKKFISNSKLKRHIQTFHMKVKTRALKNESSAKVQPFEPISKVGDPKSQLWYKCTNIRDQYSESIGINHKLIT